MATWFIKEFSKITNITVRSLQHYDRIGLLKPSKRLTNGYRVYSELDLTKVHPIVALRFMGFSLLQISKILKNDSLALQDLLNQRAALKSEMEQLQAAYTVLDLLIAHSENQANLNLPRVISFINENISAEDKQKVFGKSAPILEPSFAEEFAYYKKQWGDLITEIRASLGEDPCGEKGRQIAYAWAKLANESDNREPALKQALHDAYLGAKMPHTPFSKEVVDWLEVALKIVNREPLPPGLEKRKSFKERSKRKMIRRNV